MKITQFAPVLIPTLDRYEHFKRCVESLARCTHAGKTDLFIALDFPLNEGHWKGYKKIKQYIPEIKGFKSITVFERNNNFGDRKNTDSARDEIYKIYDRLILSEDDNEFSPNFLDYINKGLDKFENNKSITAICGYVYPVSIRDNYSHNYFFYKTFSGWGYGTWKGRRGSIYYTTKELVTFIKSPKNLYRIYRMAPVKIYSLANAIIENRPLYGDGVVSLNNIKFDKYCVFPAISKVRNYGHDGTGVHCNSMENDPFLNQEIDEFKDFNYDDKITTKNNHISKLMRKYFKLYMKQKIWFVYRYIVILLFK